VDRFLQQSAQELGQPVKKMSKKAIDVLKEYNWPGNVRELKNLIERLIILAPKAIVGAEDLPPLVPGKKVEEQFFDTGLYGDFKSAVEKEFFERKLQLYGFNVSKTARKLGMQRSNLYKKLEKYGIPYKPAKDTDSEEFEGE
jgi:two-component system nitrogen regulation response regulator NtrX